MARLTFFRKLTSRLSLRHQSSNNTLTTIDSSDAANPHPPTHSHLHHGQDDLTNKSSPSPRLRLDDDNDHDLTSPDTPATSLSRSSSPSTNSSSPAALPTPRKVSSRLSQTHSRVGSSPPLTSQLGPPLVEASAPSAHVDDVQPSSRRRTVDFTAVDACSSALTSPTELDALPQLNQSCKSTTHTATSRPVGVSFAVPADPHVTEHAPTAPAATYGMVLRKIWVKRPQASATLVQIKDDDLVDDVRDMVLRKYANSLGRTFDAPDMVLRIVSRAEHGGPRPDRILAPEEEIGRTIDAYYPGGQTVDDALIIDVPQKRTPRPSPRHLTHSHYAPGYYNMEDMRPNESGTDYFPPMAAIVPQGVLPVAPVTTSTHNGREYHLSLAPGEHPKSMSVINTGAIPMVPSPGGASTVGNPNGGRRHKERGEHRPRPARHTTSSPSIISHPPTTSANLGLANPIAPVISQPSQQPSSPQIVPHRITTRMHAESSAAAMNAPSDSHINNGVAPQVPPLPSPPASQTEPVAGKIGSTPPTPNGSTTTAHLRGPRKNTRFGDRIRRGPSRQRQQPLLADPYATNPALPNISSMLDSSVPPINVLIVEDNHITLRILETLMKRLKVRWQTAMNGQIAVDKWKKGGFHLVLMDIQMPVMNGLQATKEIRRLERVNGIGVFPASNPASPAVGPDPAKRKSPTTEPPSTSDPATAALEIPRTTTPVNTADDHLPIANGLFKSPVILVALTASSLQSDRNEALAAGCNDFLTKPVDFVWLERKVKEWGCMQALIDFDGWREWKEIAAKEEAGKSVEQKQKERDAEEKQRVKLEKLAKLQERQRANDAEKKREKERLAAAAIAAPPPGVDDSPREAFAPLPPSVTTATPVDPASHVAAQ